MSTRPNQSYIDVITLGFGTSVAMWAVAYILRLPAVQASAPLVTGGLCAMLAVGGYLAGRFTRRGWLGGLWVGLLSGVLNLLIVLSAISERLRPDSSAPVNVGQFFVIALATVAASAVLCILGAAFGNTRRARAAELPNWLAVFSKVAVAATFILIIAGGLVTSHQAGLAVPDWPNSFGHNMFLLPLSQMDNAQVFLEHAHRLWGALVGLTVLTLALLLHSAPVSGAVRLAGWLALALVSLQGLLGGLRVVETNTGLGAIHGLLAQIIFAILVGIAVAISTTWANTTTVKRYASAGLDRTGPVVLLVVLILQIAIGAEMRHFNNPERLMLHITVATLLLALVLFTGVRAWGLHSDVRIIKRRGTGLIHLTIVQILLGVLALVTGALRAEQPTFGQALAATAHQAFGALLLAWAVGVMLWNRKVLQPVEDAERRAA